MSSAFQSSLGSLMAETFCRIQKVVGVLEADSQSDSGHSWETIAENLRTKCGLKEYEIEEARISFARGIAVLRRMYCQWATKEKRA